MLRWLERRRAGIIGNLYLLILVFRDTGKTLLFTRAAQTWLHVADPNLSLYIGSETHAKAMTFLRSIKEVMSGADEGGFSWFSWLYGDWRDPRRTWSLKEIIHAARTATVIQEPSFGTFGLDMGITGMHPDGVTLDDPHSLETFTEKQAFEARESYDASYPALRTDGFYTGVMTRYGGNDVAGHMIAQEGVATWTGAPCPDPSVKVGKGKVHVYYLQGRDRAKKSEEHPKGEPVLPEVWSKERMDHYEDKDPINFAAQIMNDPSTGEHMPLEWAQLDRMEISRADLPAVDFATIHLDTAFKDDERIARGDFNVIAGVLHGLQDDGKVFVDRVLRDQKSRAEDFITLLVRYIMSLRERGIRLKCITDEMELSGKRGAFKQLLTVTLGMAGIRVGPDSIMQFNRTAKKSSRLRKAAAYWAEGHVRLIRGIEHLDRIKYEMVNLDKGDHDDIADALSDIWQPDVWKKPINRSGSHENTAPLQPGDEILRPGLLTEAFSTKDSRERRVRDVLEQERRFRNGS